MAFEQLERLEDQLEELHQRAERQTDAKLRQRILEFSKAVYDEIDLAFDEVYKLLSEIANKRPNEVNDSIVSGFQDELTKVHSSGRFKKVLLICDRLSVLAETYRKDIDAVLANSAGRYSELFWLLEKHEGMFRRTIESATDEISKELRGYKPGRDITAAQKLADDARHDLQKHIDRVRRAQISLGGKTGGIDEVLDLGKRADSLLKTSAWFNGSFYLAAAIILLGLLTFVSGQLDAFRLMFVVVGAYVGLALVGAYQLMNDGKISERGFLEALRLSLTRVLLPIARKQAT